MTWGSDWQKCDYCGTVYRPRVEGIISCPACGAPPTSPSKPGRESAIYDYSNPDRQWTIYSTQSADVIVMGTTESGWSTGY